MTMRALSMTKLSATATPTLSLIDLPIPEATPGNIIVQIRASSINPSDILNSKGGFPYTTYPRVPGRDFAGTVIAGPPHLLGLDVLGTSGRFLSFQQDGAHAEFCQVAEDAVIKKPMALSFPQAATIGVPFSTASICLTRSRVQPADVVLVIGANGSVGSAATQLARSMGCRVITAARGDSADVDLTTDPAMKKARALTPDGEGLDVVIDTTGHLELLNAGLDLLGHGGRLACIAAPRVGNSHFSFDLQSLYRNEQEIVGCNSLSYSAADMAACLEKMAPLFESGELRTLGEDQIALVDLETSLDVYAGSKQFGKKKVVIGF